MHNTQEGTTRNMTAGTRSAGTWTQERTYPQARAMTRRAPMHTTGSSCAVANRCGCSTCDHSLEQGPHLLN
eukprot:438794-Amphidinium_carterae.1